MCNGPCAIHAREHDLVVIGFPCQPYSALNQKRWDGDVFSSKSANVFMKVTEYLNHADPPPRCYVLERVLDATKRASGDATKMSPLDVFFLRHQEGGEGAP